MKSKFLFIYFFVFVLFLLSCVSSYNLNNGLSSFDAGSYASPSMVLIPGYPPETYPLVWFVGVGNSTGGFKGGFYDYYGLYGDEEWVFESDSCSINLLPSVVGYGSPTYFNAFGKRHVLLSSSTEEPVIYTDSGSNCYWYENVSYSNGLSLLDSYLSFAYFEDGGDSLLMAGSSSGNFYFLFWNGSEWIEAPDFLWHGLPDLLSRAKPTIFKYSDDLWYLLLTDETLNIYGYYWDSYNETWVSTSFFNSTIPITDENSRLSVFNYSNDFYVMIGSPDGKLFVSPLGSDLFEPYEEIVLPLSTTTFYSWDSFFTGVGFDLDSFSYDYMWIKDNTNCEGWTQTYTGIFNPTNELNLASVSADLGGCGWGYVQYTNGTIGFRTGNFPADFDVKLYGCYEVTEGGYSCAQKLIHFTSFEQNEVIGTIGDEISGVSEFFSNIFGDADNMTNRQKASYVLISCLLLAVALFIVGFSINKAFDKGFIYLILFFEFVLLVFFTSIGYISLFSVIVFLLILVTVLFIFRGRGG